MLMIRYLITSFCLLLPLLGYSQKLSLEPLVSLRLIKANSTMISVGDTLFAFEENTHSTEVSFGLKVTYALSQRFQLSSGVEYFLDGATFTVINNDQCQFCPVRKSWGAFTNTFVFPQQGNLQVYRNKNWRLYAVAGLAPIVNFERSQPTVKSDNRNLTAGVAEVMNSLSSTRKPVYFDYTVGAKLSYGSMNLYVHYQDNVSNSVSGPLSVYGHVFPFTRNTRSWMASLSYSLFKGKEE